MTSTRWETVVSADTQIQTIQALVEEYDKLVIATRPVWKEQLRYVISLGLFLKNRKGNAWLYLLMLWKVISASLSQSTNSLIRKIERAGNGLFTLIAVLKALLAFNGQNTYTNMFQSSLSTENILPDLDTHQEGSTGANDQTIIMRQIVMGLIDGLFETRLPATLWSKYKELRNTTKKISCQPNECAFCILRDETNSVLTNPYSANCGHTFCYACVMSRKELIVDLKCPICHAKIHRCTPSTHYG
ncbi:ubiquitin-protein ligase E3 [Schizosaccharomyces cryophilus OY26]|uniref:Ubiquitin-protein ligase E3 n=1 Tax=Schizosaccharomyces cryophilus (strain OY26 / ATCC MYA-4695 / CBS 11777 / NBRC 106824 / NRRL Y48691) TaxID=653667 RepID=S9VZ11_SCHCR|nr:ubiquitin-protein ligase E3 [Schizosaccharomyces cryophilus OY26]EPY51449.1 ubiquitin-protein ligase E3 [Schizosaccharomyces cryophilus OY26]